MPVRLDVVGVLIDQKFMVGAVDRVVQHGAVESDLDIVYSAQWPAKRKGVADLDTDGAADAFVAEWRGEQVIVAARGAGSPVTLAAREPRADRDRLCRTRAHLAGSIKNPVAP